jgi:MFS family permease
MLRTSTRTPDQTDPDRAAGVGRDVVRTLPGVGEAAGPLGLAGFRRFLLGGFLSTIGSEMQAVAVGWVLYRRTGSAAALGLVGLTQIVPIVLLAIPVGVAADRFSRKALLLGSQVLMALASLGLAILVSTCGPIPLHYACLILGGAGVALQKPARWSIIPGLVRTEDLGDAMAWYSGGLQLASVAGPALGGLILSTAGAGSVFLIDVLAAVGVLALLASVPVARTPRAEGPLSTDAHLAGFRFIWKTKLILATLVLDLFAVLLGGATALLPIFAQDILHVGPSGLGWLRAAPSIGAALMSLTLAYGPRLRRTGPILLGSVTGFGAATVVFGLSRNPLLSFAMLLVIGALDNVSVIVRATLVQRLTPDPLRGRVSAVKGLFVGSSNELGAIESGLAAQLLGPVAAVVLGGVGAILVVLAVALAWPQVRSLDAMDHLAESG